MKIGNGKHSSGTGAMQQSKPQVLIAWDVDDVLNHLTWAWAQWAGIQFSSEVRATGEASTWLARQGLSQDSYLDSLDEFRASHYRDLEPNPSILALLSEYDFSGSTHIALTATPMFAQPIVAEWTVRHYAKWFRGVWFSPSPRRSDPAGTQYPTKGDVLGALSGFSTLIDDSETNLETLPSSCTAILYPQPWNSGSEKSFLISVSRIGLEGSNIEGSVS